MPVAGNDVTYNDTTIERYWTKEIKDQRHADAVSLPRFIKFKFLL